MDATTLVQHVFLSHDDLWYTDNVSSTDRVHFLQNVFLQHDGILPRHTTPICEDTASLTHAPTLDAPPHHQHRPPTHADPMPNTHDSNAAISTTVTARLASVTQSNPTRTRVTVPPRKTASATPTKAALVYANPAHSVDTRQLAQVHEIFMRAQDPSKGKTMQQIVTTKPRGKTTRAKRTQSASRKAPPRRRTRHSDDDRDKMSAQDDDWTDSDSESLVSIRSATDESERSGAWSLVSDSDDEDIDDVRAREAEEDARELQDELDDGFSSLDDFVRDDDDEYDTDDDLEDDDDDDDDEDEDEDDDEVFDTKSDLLAMSILDDGLEARQRKLAAKSASAASLTMPKQLEESKLLQSRLNGKRWEIESSKRVSRPRVDLVGMSYSAQSMLNEIRALDRTCKNKQRQVAQLENMSKSATIANLGPHHAESKDIAARLQKLSTSLEQLYAERDQLQEHYDHGRFLAVDPSVEEEYAMRDAEEESYNSQEDDDSDDEDEDSDVDSDDMDVSLHGSEDDDDDDNEEEEDEEDDDDGLESDHDDGGAMDVDARDDMDDVDMGDDDDDDDDDNVSE